MPLRDPTGLPHAGTAPVFTFSLPRASCLILALHFNYASESEPWWLANLCEFPFPVPVSSPNARPPVRVLLQAGVTTLVQHLSNKSIAPANNAANLYPPHQGGHLVRDREMLGRFGLASVEHRSGLSLGTCPQGNKWARNAAVIGHLPGLEAP